MTTRRGTRIRLENVRPLGARLTFVDDEWLPSMFRRVGHAVGTYAEDVMNWCGLYDITPQARGRLGNRLTPKAIDGISVALGFSAAQLQTTVMDNLPHELVSLRADGTPVQSKDWSRGGGTRYCVDCLRERPGVFYTQWRLWWSFICERHHTVLRAVCPACHQDIVEATVYEREPRDPGLCWSTRKNGDFCLHSLTDTWAETPVGAESPMLQAQLELARRWSNAPTDSLGVWPATLRGTGIALLGAGDLNRIADLAGVPVADLRGLFDQRDRTGGTPPREPLAMAALVGAAYRLITGPETEVQDAIRQTTFTRPVRSTDTVEGPGSARYLLNYWPGIDEKMRWRVVRALDRDLPPIQRLVHGSAASGEAFQAFQRKQEPVPGDPAALWSGLEASLYAPGSAFGKWWADRSVPKLLWPSWAAPLDVAGRTEATTLQMALADALRIAGTGAHPDDDAIAGIGKRLRPSMLGNRDQTDTVLRQLCDLALALRAHPGPIDYERRLRLPVRHLLLDEHWQAVAESVGEDPGAHRRLRNARRYAFLRMSGAGPRHLPEVLGMRAATQDAAEYTNFTLTMSAELKIAIDAYLIGWLALFKSNVTDLPFSARGQIVVAHEPPRFTHPGAKLAPELDDIDLPLLHELVGNGEHRLGVLADAVDRTQRHVRWAIAAHPVPSGRLIRPIDWIDEMGRLPQYAPGWYEPEPEPPWDTSWIVEKLGI